MITVGPWSLALLLASAHGLVVAALLVAAPRNRVANRHLAALILVVVGMLTPYTLGYAGFYDAYPWLAFAPLRYTLALGPLMLGYVRRLVDDTPTPRAWLHYVPVFAQAAYYAIVFAQPTATKWTWDAGVHVVFVAPLERVALDVSLVAYGIAAWRCASAYQRWLVDHSAAREELQLSWLRGFLVAMALATIALIVHHILDAAVGLSYADDFPLYAGLALVVYWLGIEGLRHANAAYPPQRAPEPQPAAAKTATTPDWPALGEHVAAAVAGNAWWREPDLDLAELARRLGTNTQYLSRALNEGLGERFSDFINRQRVAEAQRLLAGDGDVLAIALAVGFGSKASFHRAFRAHAGCTPGQWRERTAPARLNP